MSPQAQLHATAAVAAIALGAWQLAAAGRGARHRRVGYLWFAAMTLTALSSFLLKGSNGIALLGGFSWIHGLSLYVLLAIVLAIRAAIARNIRAHRRWVVGAYAGLVVAGVFAVALPGRAMHQILFETLPSMAMMELK